MDSRPAGHVRVVAAWAAVGLVGWQALASVRDVEVELGQPLARHVLVLRSNAEELVRKKLGPDHALLEALRAHVPRDGRVLVSFRNERGGYKELRRRTTWLGSLVYPMVLEGWPFDPARPAGATAKAGWRAYVLDLESGRDFSPWPCEELARGPGFRLLLAGGEAR